MNEVESRRIIPIARITLGLVVILALFQVFMLSGMYELKSSTVKKTAPWFYNTFLKLVGEDPSTHPMAETAVTEKSGPSGIASVAGFNPEELSVTIEGAEEPLPGVAIPEEQPNTVIPVSQPEKPAPVDEDIPVG